MSIARKQGRSYNRGEKVVCSRKMNLFIKKNIFIHLKSRSFSFWSVFINHYFRNHSEFISTSIEHHSKKAKDIVSFLSELLHSIRSRPCVYIKC